MHLNDRHLTLLTVGPLPPPLTGTTVSYRVFCESIRKEYPAIELLAIDTSQKRLKSDVPVISPRNAQQALATLISFRQELQTADCALIFGSNGFQLSLMPILLSLAKLSGKPCYVRPFGGSLDNFIRAQKPPLRRWLLRALGSADGVIVETQLLQTELANMGLGNVSMVPGYRAPQNPKNVSQHVEDRQLKSHTRFAFVGHVREEKGVLEIFEAMRILGQRDRTDIVCHVFGPIYPKFMPQFTSLVEEIETMKYGGVIAPEDVIQSLGSFDAFVFPSYYQGEGHPGVVIEAMMAGLPVISTQHRAIPELIQHGHNGLLVPIKNALLLADAMEMLSNHPEMRFDMASRNRQIARRFETSNVIPQLLSRIDLLSAITMPETANEVQMQR